MVKAIALNTVHVCIEPGERSENGRVKKAAKIDVVTPGKIFDASAEQLAEFEAVGAARAATKKDIATADADDKAPAPDAEPKK